MSWLLNFDKILPGFLRVLLRGAGQVVFCDNAATGLIVLAAFYTGGIITGLAATIGLISSTVAAYTFKFEKKDIEVGLCGFNGVLAGACLSIFLEHTPLFWFYVVFASMLSSILWVALTRTLQALNIPAATSPFVLISWIFLMLIYAFDNHALGSILPIASTQPVAIDIGALSLETWFTALIRGIGQIVFTDNLFSGGLLLAAITITTLRGALMVIGGAFIGVIMPMLIGVNQSVIETGLYGFNPILTMIAVGWVFFAHNSRTTLLAILASILTVLCQAGLTSLLSPLGLPVLASPFILTLWIVLFIVNKSRNISGGGVIFPR
ncbi:urea transporter [Nitrosomonas sp. Nm84]|uniref:urea transporter n=1 Tax=Nitrosomonas sp. Nm84 TaxID=200124 RepID=UPI000D76C077|nr:urea transporter [Nitrosomonas sp. Nm84]PXW86898.1 urea transporter [Nitrosomonas sp. Nm84]